MSKSSSDLDLGSLPSKQSPRKDEDEDKDDQQNEENESGSGSGDTKIGIQGSEIPLASLTGNQLNQLRQQLGIEMNALQNNLRQLQVAGDRFRSSAECLSMYKKGNDEYILENKDKPNAVSSDGTLTKLLIPLSQSVFCDGYVSDPNKVLVDIGTGYYLEKKIEAACEFLHSKVETIQKNATGLQQLMKKKESVLEEATGRLQQMVKEQEAAQGA